MLRKGGISGEGGKTINKFQEGGGKILRAGTYLNKIHSFIQSILRKKGGGVAGKIKGCTITRIGGPRKRELAQLEQGLPQGGAFTA